MKEKFKNIPQALKTQIFIRLGLAVLAVILAILMSVIAKDFLLGLPCWVLFVYMGINGGILLYNGITENYVSINGTCISVERSRIFRRVKTVTIQTEKGKLKVPIRKRIKKLNEGVTVTVYVSVKSRVYDNGDGMAIFGYYAIDVFSTK